MSQGTQFFSGKGSDMGAPRVGGNAFGTPNRMRDPGVAALSSPAIKRPRLGKKQTPKLSNKISTKLTGLGGL